MALERPAFEATIENLDTAWTQTVAAGDTYNPVDGAWLSDGLQLSWRFADIPPAQLEPEIAQFEILADGIANLPTFELGDRITIDLVRPTDTDPIRYMKFSGRITDTDLTTDAGAGRVMLSLTAADPTSELNQVVRDPAGPGGTFITTDYYLWWYYAKEVLFAIAARTLTPTATIPWDATGNLLVLFAPNRNTGEYLSRLLPMGLLDPTETSYPVSRYLEDGDGWYYSPLVELSLGYPVPITCPWFYYLAEWNDALDADLPALFKYAWSATDADQVTTIDNPSEPDADGSVTLLDACLVEDLASWTRDRSSAPNEVGVIGHDVTDPYPDAPAQYATDVAAVDRYGAQPKVLQAETGEVGAGRLAQELLERYPVNSADVWQLKNLTVRTDVMDDETLDTYAPLFWTERYPVPGVMGRRIVLHSVGDDVDPTGGFSVFHLAGATFACQDGRLVITPELAPAPLTREMGKTAGPTYDAFGASAFGAAKYHDQGGTTDYIAPGLTYDRAKLTSL